MSTKIYNNHGIQVTRFWGGEKRGKCYLFTFLIGKDWEGKNHTVDTEYTEREFKALIKELNKLH